MPSASTSRDAIAFFSRQTFVRVVDELPRTRDVSGSNYCNLAVRAVRGRAVVVSVIDNLIKGAAGVAVRAGVVGARPPRSRRGA